jgi:hypothetical protein
MRPKNMGKHVRLWTREPYSEIQISCQKHNLESIPTDYIYPISYKIAKKANPMKWICPIGKRYHRF